MSARTFWLGLALGALVCGGVLASPREAHAKFFVINVGDEIYDVGELPPEMQQEAPPGDWKLGYMCSHFGILWADAWTWGCNLVAYEGNTYADLPPDIKQRLESTYSMSDANRGAWNKYGIWLFVGLFVGGLLMRGEEAEG